MHLGRTLGIGLLSIVVAWSLGAVPTAAAQPAPSGLRLAADRAPAGAETTLQVGLTDAAGEPIVEATITLERRTSGAWAPIGTVQTDEAGRAVQPVTMRRVPADNVFRAAFAGDEEHEPATAQTQVELERRGSRIRLDGPDSVRDGRTVRLRVHWTTGQGEPVAGRVHLYRATASGRWQRARALRTGADGRAQVAIAPRQDSRWRVRGVAKPWVEGAASAVHRIANLPPGRPVRLPRGAPRPRTVPPPQPRASGPGADVVITPIPTRVWRSMVGASWHRGCPVGRAGLRLIRVTYWDYTGYRRRGELVAATAAARPMGAAFAEMYRRKLPVRTMYRVDRFGWGKRSHGGDDYASMAAGNTSAFNCRDVTGRPGVRSPHSYGRSLDVNTWENPYRSARGLVPNRWWQSRSHPRVAWRSRSHPVVALMARHGFRWTYGLGDTQHFDYVGGPARARVLPRPCDRFCD